MLRKSWKCDSGRFILMIKSGDVNVQLRLRRFFEYFLILSNISRVCRLNTFWAGDLHEPLNDLMRLPLEKIWVLGIIFCFVLILTANLNHTISPDFIRYIYSHKCHFKCRLSMSMRRVVLCPSPIFRSTRLHLWLPQTGSRSDCSWQPRGSLSENPQNMMIMRYHLTLVPDVTHLCCFPHLWIIPHSFVPSISFTPLYHCFSVIMCVEAPHCHFSSFIINNCTLLHSFLY